MSPPSSRGSSPEAAFSDAEAAARLAQLEKLLQSSLGYDDADAVEERVEQPEQPPKKKRRKGKEVVVPVVEPTSAPAESMQVDEDEVVAFRLFSTQKTPQAVVIREKEGWDAVKDPRIRDAADESEAVLRQRMLDIASIAVDGTSLVANAALEPLTAYAGRVTTRKLTSRALLPTLAYLNAVLPSPDAPVPSPPKSKETRKKDAPKVPANGPAARVQAVRRPLERLANVKLELVTLLKAGSESASRGKKTTRVSKSRRAAAHRRMVAPVK